MDCGLVSPFQGRCAQLLVPPRALDIGQAPVCGVLRGSVLVARSPRSKFERCLNLARDPLRPIREKPSVCGDTLHDGVVRPFVEPLPQREDRNEEQTAEEKE